MTKKQKALHEKIDRFIDDNVMFQWLERREADLALSLVEALGNTSVPVRVVRDFIEECGTVSNLRDDNDRGKASDDELERAVAGLWKTANKLIAKVK